MVYSRGGRAGADKHRLAAGRGQLVGIRVSAHTALGNGAGVTDRDIGDARDGDIGEVVAHVAINVFTNYFNSVAETTVDFPAVRAPRRTEHAASQPPFGAAV